RQKGSQKVISRMYMCSPRDKERFYLRILLAQIPKAISYEAIRTINGFLYNTYEEAVRQLGLLDEENSEFDKCLKEAATYQMPSRLRQLFASILLFCDPRELNITKLYHTHIYNLSEDFIRQQKQIKGTQNLSDDD